MPDRYWVGGSGTWDTTSTARWSATSGGPPGASAPTSADDVFFDANSGAPLTINSGVAATQNCRNLTISVSGVTHAGTGGGLSIAGSMVLASGTSWTRGGSVTFTATTAGNTITTNGASLASAVTFNGVGGVWTLGSAFTNTNTSLTVTNGTLNTAGFAVTTPSFLSNNSNTRAINLSTSTVTVTGTNGSLNFSNSTNLTFDAGTSQINMAVNTGFSGGARTFHNVSFTSTSLNNNNNISGANTFNNLTVSAPGAGSPMRFLTIEEGQTINGTLTCGGASPIRRIFVMSNTIGTARTLTVATLAANDCDFRDITLAGAAAGTAPTRASDCGGNSGITFPAAKTVFRVGTSTTWTGSSSWATTSGGAGSDSNFPLAQDTAIINNSTALTGTLSLDSANIGTVDASARTTGITLNHNGGIARYGSYTLGSGVTVTGTSTQTFSGRGTMDFTSAGKTITFPIEVGAPGGTFRQLGATTLTNSCTLSMGTLDLNDLTFTCTSFTNTTSAFTRTIAFGVGNVTVTGAGTVYSGNVATGLTVTGTPVVNVTNATATATTVTPGSPTENNSISFNFTAGTYSLTLSSGDVRSLNFTGFAGTLNNATRRIYGDLTLSTGMTLTAGTAATSFSSTSATPCTIRTNGKTLDFMIRFDGVGGTRRLLDAFTVGSTRSTRLTNGTLDLNGFTFTTGANFIIDPGIKNITFNGGTLTCPADFTNSFPGFFTTTAGTGTGTINMISAASKNFFGGGSTFNCTLNNGGTGALNIYGSNTFTTLANSVQPTSFLFEDSETTTLTNWNISGTPGNRVTINSIVGAGSHGLSKASGTVTADYLSITNSFAFGGATWDAGANSLDNGFNSGWTFAQILGGGNFFMMLRL